MTTPKFEQLEPDDFSNRLAEAYTEFMKLVEVYRPAGQPEPRHTAVLAEHTRVINMLENVAYGTIVLHPEDSERILYHIMVAVELAFILGYNVRKEEETYKDAERLLEKFEFPREE